MAEEDWTYTTEPIRGGFFVGAISDEMVESVMRDLLTAQLAVIQTLKPEVHDDYMRAMRNHVRSALVRAFKIGSAPSPRTDQTNTEADDGR